MQLPAKLLHRVRVGFGVGAVMLGGCDLVEDASAQVLGEPVAIAVADAPAPAAAPAPATAPEPMLLGRGISGVVGESIARVENGSGRAETSAVVIHAEAEPGAVVPFADPLAGLDPEPRSSIRPRPRPEPSAIAVDEPCDPPPRTKVRTTTKSEPKVREWQCPACGRG